LSNRMKAVTNAVVVLALATASSAFVIPTRNSLSLALQAVAPTGAAGSKSLDYNPDKYNDPNNSNFRKLSDALKAADVEKRLEDEEARARQQAAQMRREERQRKIDFMKSVPDDEEAGTVDEYMYKEGVKNILDRLDHDLVGLLPVKRRVREVAALLVLDKMRGNLGFDTSVPSLHMCFTGAPGTGKTTVAIRMGEILAKMGYARKGHVVVATRDDLVGQYVGHTAPKTKEMIKKAFGGVLLVDEAYYLYNAANDKDYGQESIEILLNVMEAQREDLVVILAGYKDRMDRFFSYIPGMSSRVGNHIEFPNFEVDELVDIAKVMARDLQYEFAPDADAAFKRYIEKRLQFPFFSNARTVRNAMDRARMNSAIRVFNEAMSGKNDGFVGQSELVTITAADFEQLVTELDNAEEGAIVA